MNTSLPPVDIKDPRIRYTFADVAMKLVLDGPTYGVLFLVGVLALRGNIEGLQIVMGAAFALQARSRPPEGGDKVDKLARGIIGVIVILFVVTGGMQACK